MQLYIPTKLGWFGLFIGAFGVNVLFYFPDVLKIFQRGIISTVLAFVFYEVLSNMFERKQKKRRKSE